MCFKCGGIFNDRFIVNFLAIVKSEKILKIGLHLMKTLTHSVSENSVQQ